MPSVCHGKILKHKPTTSDQVGDDPAPWTPVDWRTLPAASPADSVDLYYLVAPLLEDDIGPILGELGLYHGAIAFVNKNTNFSITLNYDADDIFRASFFPYIVSYPNGTKDLNWVNGGAAFIYMDINTTYWISGTYKVTTIPGNMYNDFISQWNAKVNVTEAFYDMFAVMDKWGGTCFVESWDCFDYVWESFQVLYDMGAKLNESLILNRDFSNIYVTEPPTDVTPLYFADPRVHDEIVAFYEFIEFKWGQLSWWEFIWDLLDTFDGVFYYRQANTYWKMQLHPPFFGFDWYPDPLPGQHLNQTLPISSLRRPPQRR